MKSEKFTSKFDSKRHVPPIVRLHIIVREVFIVVLFAVLCIAAVLLFVGFWEIRWHQANVDAIPLRINVNGSRGKSTVTRLITGILIAAGWRAVGKTTGSAARMLYWFSEEERPIRRGPLGANISEQKMVVAEAAGVQADALVSECMALKPAYQKVFQERLVQANITVLTNVLTDHLDVMGPTTDDVARVFAASIPWRGVLVIAPGPYADYFTEIAVARQTAVYLAAPATIAERDLHRFPYMLFAENVALALAVADALRIEADTAWRGMLRVAPDPGALRYCPLHENMFFFNGFAANDPQSSLAVWEKIVASGFPAEHPLILLNCRADRMERTQQFVEHVLPHLPPHTLLAIGGRTDPIATAIAEGRLDVLEYVDLEQADVDTIIASVHEIAQARVQSTAFCVLGLGNIYGVAMELVNRWLPGGDTVAHVR